MAPSARLLCYWGGNIIEDSDGYSYDCGPKKLIKVEGNWTFNCLMDKLYSCIRADKEHVRLKLSCRYPRMVGVGAKTCYIRVPIEDDGDVEAMFDLQSQFSQLSSIELFIEMEAIVIRYGSYTQIPASNGDGLSPPRHDLSTPIRDSTLLDIGDHPTQSSISSLVDNDIGESYCGGPSKITPQGVGVTGRVSSLLFPLDIMIDLRSEASAIIEPAIIDNEHEKTDLEGEEDAFMERLNEYDDGEDYVNGISTDMEVQRHLYEPKEHFFTDIDSAPAAVITSPLESNDARVWHPEHDELRVGLIFKDKDEFVKAILRYHVKHNLVYKVKKSIPTMVALKCKFPDKCNFQLRATCKKSHGHFEITRYQGPHICPLRKALNQDQHHLNYRLITDAIRNIVEVDPMVRISSLIAAVKEKFEYTISYKKAWKAKVAVIANLFGKWEESYRILPRFLAAIQKYNAGTIVEYDPKACGKINAIRFKRVFWAFRPCIMGFRFCRPVISIDGTFLHGKYLGTMLIAVAADGNNQILPLAFAIVEGENHDSWSWFLQHVRDHVVPSYKDVCLISDRHPGILSVRKNQLWQPPYAYHRFCLRHIRSNFTKKFSSAELKKLLWAAGKATQVRKFNKLMEEIRKFSVEAKKWCDEIPVEQWTLAHDGGKRFGMVTTNISEVFNSVLKGSRGLPITALVQTSFHRCVHYFNLRRNLGAASVADQLHYVPSTILAIQQAKRKIGSMFVQPYNTTGDRGDFLVKNRHGQNEQIVRLQDKTCTCGKLTTYGIPCSHVLACCAVAKLDPSAFISPYFSVCEYRKIWAEMFQPLEHPDFWEEWIGCIFMPPAVNRGKGRPRSVRLCNEMDIRLERQPKRCGLCKNTGHDRRTCHAKKTAHGGSDT